MDVGIVPVQRLRNTTRRSRRTRHVDESIELTAGLLPDLLPHLVIRGDLIGVLQLIGPESARALRDVACGVDHPLRQ